MCFFWKLFWFLNQNARRIDMEGGVILILKKAVVEVCSKICVIKGLLV